MSAGDTLRIAVLGAGAMGSLVGGALAAAGASVTLLDIDDAHIEAVGRDGLRMSTPSGERVVALAAMRPEHLHENQDLVVVLTKQPQTRPALASIAAVLTPACHVLTLQNGLGNQEILEEVVPRERILLGVTTYPADLLEPGHVGCDGEGEIRLMAADGVERPLVGAIAGLLNAGGQRCVVDPDLASAIWSKVAFNCAMNSICALTNSMVGQLGADPDGRRLALDVVEEVVAVAGRAGVAVDLGAVLATVEHALDTHLTHLPSMLRDMLAGRPTEIASINGAVVAVAARLGQPAPLTSALQVLVRLAEASRRSQEPRH